MEFLCQLLLQILPGPLPRTGLCSSILRELQYSNRKCVNKSPLENRTKQVEKRQQLDEMRVVNDVPDSTCDLIQYSFQFTFMESFLKCNGIETDAIQEDKIHSYECTDQQRLSALHRHNQMREEDSCKGQSKHEFDLLAGKNAIAVLVIRERLMTAQSRNEVVPGALHQVLSFETSAEKGYPSPSHPRNPFYQRSKESTLWGARFHL